jgi:FdhE protein
MSMPAETASELKGEQKYINDLTQRAPYASDILQAFGNLVLERRRCSEQLDTAGIFELTCDPEKCSQGIPLLADINSNSIIEVYQQAWQCMMPLLIKVFPGIESELRVLENALSENHELAKDLLDMMDDKQIGDHSKTCVELGVSRQVMEFAAREILKPCMERLAQNLAPMMQDMPWSKGYCPICGSNPDLAFLRPKDPEPSEFLISKSGQLWMHCSLCAHKWRFLRSKCPHCGDVEPENLSYFSSPDRKDERVYTCKKCNHYFHCVDTTDRKSFPDLNLEALALIHLDYLAQEKGYKPLVHLPWNQFTDQNGTG